MRVAHNATGEENMLKILSDGDSKHRLEDSAGTQLGWIHGRSIGFRNFATESDARDAAIAGWGVLDRSLRQQYAGWPRHEPKFDELRTIHDGAYEWFYDGTVAIARLLRPQRRAYDYSFGIELVLPSYASEGVAIAAAYSVAMAIAPYRDALPAPIDRSAAHGGGVMPEREATPLV
jgi:hypothetical protein